MLAREGVHICKRVGGIGGGVVGHDGNAADPERLQRLCLCDKAADDCLHVRAVIADEGHQRTVAAAHVAQRMRATIDASKGEIGCAHAKPQ